LGNRPEHACTVAANLQPLEPRPLAAQVPQLLSQPLLQARVAGRGVGVGAAAAAGIAQLTRRVIHAAVVKRHSRAHVGNDGFVVRLLLR
jgi:hypothetical protein